MDPGSPPPIPNNAESTVSALTALHDLYQAGHYTQVISQGRQLLERDPESVGAHYILALAFLISQQPPAAVPHVEFLLTRAPDESFSHHAACRYYAALRRWREAERHIQTALSLEPNSALYHSDAAIIALRQARIPQARASLETALRLDPQNPDVIRLCVEVRGLNETTAREAWQRIQHFEQALALDPNNAELHASIGDVYLDELDEPRRAEESYRQALSQDPSRREHQRRLFKAVGQQRLLYRLLSIPNRTFAWMGLYGRALALQPWRILILLVLFKAVFIFLGWLALATVLFWPACKIYEWLLISEIQCASDASPQHLRLKRLLHRWPFWVRLLCFGAGIFGLWAAFYLAIGIPLIGGFVFLGVMTGAHFLVTLLLFATGKSRSALGRRAASERPAPLIVPPPLPVQPPPLPPHLRRP